MEGDLFILPSTTERFGLAALEAMAAGMPVISSNSGGLPEVNEHGFSGFLSDVGATIAIAWTGVLHRNLAFSVFNDEAAAPTCCMAKLDQFLASLHADLTVFRTVPVLDRPFTLCQLFEHRKTARLGSDGHREPENYHAQGR